jgi:hypothetical protein
LLLAAIAVPVGMEILVHAIAEGFRSCIRGVFSPIPAKK